MKDRVASTLWLIIASMMLSLGFISLRQPAEQWLFMISLALAVLAGRQSVGALEPYRRADSPSERKR